MKSTSESPRREEQSPPPKPLPLPTPPARPKPPVLKWLVWGAVLVAVIAAGAWFLRPKPKDPASLYETTPVQRRTVEARVTATGTVSAHVTVQVGSQVSGRVQEILVDFNSPVKKGQVIARIDPQLMQAELERSKANLLAARASLEKARVQAENSKLQADRAKTLREQQFIAQADLETAVAAAKTDQTQVTSAEAALAQAQAALNEADVNLRYTTIVSPTDGTVISRSVDVGQTVAASLQAPTLFTIAEDLRSMQVDTSVAESDVGRLTDGMTANFTVDAWPGETFQGTIRQIRNASQTVQNVVTYDAVIDVQNPQLRLKPGMTANVTFITARADNALTVPNPALRFRPPMPPGGEGKHHGQGHGAWAGGKGAEGGAGAQAGAGASHEAGGPGGPGGASAQAGAGAAEGSAAAAQAGGEEQPPPTHVRAPGTKVVFVLRDGHPAPVRVKPGVSDGTYTQVEGELNEGDNVITAMTTEGPQGASGNTNANVKIPGMGGGGGGRNGGGGGFRPPGPF